MKKYILLSIFALCNLSAHNLVPVIKSNAENLNKIYHTVCENSLSVLQHRNLNSRTINEICTNPSDFLESKILEQDNLAEVSFIPKSLYQLLVLSCILNKVKKLDLDEHSNHTDRSKEINDLLSANAFGEGTTFFIGENGNKQSFSCSNCMNRTEVQNFFWELNDFIVQFLGNDNRKHYEQIQLSAITHQVIGNIFSLPADAFFNNLAQRRIASIHYAIHELACQEIISKIDTLIWEEYISHSYIIYRGTEKFTTLDDTLVFQMPRSLDHSFSFSDGIFGGIIYDGITGMAFGYWNPSHLMLSVHISVNDLLHHENGAEIFYIPPVIPLGAALGYGELHHVRTKVSIDMGEEAFETNKISAYKILPERHPELFIEFDEAGLAGFIQNYECAEQFFNVQKNDNSTSKWYLITIKKKRRRKCEVI